MPITVKSLAEWEREKVTGMLSIIIPAFNEEDHIEATVRSLYKELSEAKILHEILVINDCSSDQTEKILINLQKEILTLTYANNFSPHGFGFALRLGLSLFKGDFVAIFMADSSDSPKDLIAFYNKIKEGYDCVFGSRFIKGGRCIDYPLLKRVFNRMGNNFIRALFWIKYNDITNAFKLYRRDVIAGVQPLLSSHFNLTVEIPLKAIIRGYKYAILPNSWSNRKEGISKFRIKEMGSRYLFIIFYCFLEKLLSRGDYEVRKEQNKNKLQVWPR